MLLFNFLIFLLGDEMRVLFFGSATLTAGCVFSQFGAFPAVGSAMVSLFALDYFSKIVGRTHLRMDPLYHVMHKNKYFSRTIEMIPSMVTPVVVMGAMRIFSRFTIPNGIGVLGVLGLSLYAVTSVLLYRRGLHNQPPPPFDPSQSEQNAAPFFVPAPIVFVN
jgi:hypothetical protein